jgi:hypothetical protein
LFLPVPSVIQLQKTLHFLQMARKSEITQVDKFGLSNLECEQAEQEVRRKV